MEDCAKDGIFMQIQKTYTIYIKYNKQVYSGNDWQKQMLPKFCPIVQGSSLTATTTPGANGTNGDGTGSGDGTTDGGTTDNSYHLCRWSKRNSEISSIHR